MGTERTWNLACERAAYNDRTFGKAPGQNAQNLNDEMATGRWRTSGTARKHDFTSAKAIARNPRPHTGKREWDEGEDRSGYDGPINVARSQAKTPRHWRLIDKATNLLSERERDARLGDVPTAHLNRLETEIRAEVEALKSVTTGDVARAIVVARAVELSI